jgi:hypothetical protein
MSDEIPFHSPPAQQVYATSRTDRNALIAIVLGLLTAATILLLIYQVNRALQLRIETAEVWSDYQVRIAKATIEEDPNLKQQYTEEQDVLQKHAADLKDRSTNAKHAARLSGFAALFVLLGTAAAVVAFLSKSVYLGYIGILLSIIGVGFEIRGLF